MKSEENAIRTRMAETIRFRDGETFKSWSEDKQRALLLQLGAMTLYHCCLISRCEADGVLLR
jgi:antibiotic biosynthesis monooxygenase (ABM) superfamily enzyme